MAPHGHRRAGSGVVARVAWLTVSDTRTETDDEGGRIARSLIEAAGHAVADYAIVRDEPRDVEARVRAWLDRDDIDVVITSGGTGVSTRDRTFEALSGLVDRRLDGFGELFRMLSWEQVRSAAMLSRAFGGIALGHPLFVLPGSSKAVRLALESLILPELGHLLAELRR